MLNFTDATGNVWAIGDTGSFTSGTRMAANAASVFDSASNLSVSNAATGATAFMSWALPVVSTPSSQLVTGSSVAEALSVTRDTFAGNGFVRYVETFTNTGLSAKTINVTLGDDIWYDGSSTIVATANGDLLRGTNDNWFAVGSTNVTSPKVVHVVAGGVGVAPSATTDLNYAGVTNTSFNLSLAAGETKSLVHFYALAADAASATIIGNSIANLSNSAYLAGVLASNLNVMVNFSQDVSSGITTTLLPYQGNLTLTGLAAINGTGNAADNVITGNAANNILNGLAGNDTLNGGAGADTMTGGLGNDTFVVDNAGDVVVENANEGIDTVKSSVSFNISAKPYIENITLTGAAAISATGNGANNVLDGSLNSAANALAGGLGNDTYILGAGDTVVEAAAAGTDTVTTGTTYTLAANLENLVLSGAANVNGTGNVLNNVISGNAGNNILSGGDGNDTLDGGAGTDTLIGGAGNDTYVVNSAADVVTEAAAAGIDTVTASVNYTLGLNVENLTLAGTAHQAVGNALNNTLTGNASENLLDGGVGADVMSGGAGNDIYVVDNAGDVINEFAFGGVDTVRTSLANYTLQSEVENVVMLGGAASITGNASDNDITGNSLNNTLVGGLGNDHLRGGGGNDILNGGDGNDMLIGDSGAPDRVVASGETSVNGSPVVLNISAPESGTGTVQISGTISGVNLGQTAVNLVYIVDQSGSMSSLFSGAVNVGDLNNDGVSNTIMDAAIASYQKLNQSIIDAGMGAQVNLALVPFSDTATVLYSGNPAQDANGNGISDLNEQLSTLVPLGGTNYTAAIDLARQHLATLGSGKNIVFFASDGAPNDTLYLNSSLPALRAMGQDGTTIRAIGMGAGANQSVLDILDDGIINQSATIVTDPAQLDASLVNASVLSLAQGAWVEIYNNGLLVDLISSDKFSMGPLGLQFKSGNIALSASGTDQVTAKLMTLDANGAMVQATLSVAVTPFVSNDTLIGGAGNDLLDGGFGIDSMTGGIGDDIYVVDNVGDTVVELALGGIDTVRSKLASYTLGAEVENLELLGASAINGTGNAAANLIVGNALNNNLSGLDGNDTLQGGDGNDILNGGLGSDTMVGGQGDDTYYVDNAWDVVTETTTGGTDTVITSINTALGWSAPVAVSQYIYNVENLTLAAGSAALNGVGSDVDNVIVGNQNANNLYGLLGNDTLNGGTGADVMNGGDGNDIYYVDNAGDSIVDSSGVDTVISSLNGYTLTSPVEKLTLAAVATVLSGNGNALANTLVGNAYNNILDGSAGADTMQGGAGNDTYYIDNVMDKVVEAVAGGTADGVYSSVSYALGVQVENLTLTGVSGIGAAGNDLANILTGNAGNNRLVGYLGADTLIGGAGKDTLIGGAGNDIFKFNAVADSAVGINHDTITDFLRGADKIDLSAIDANAATVAVNDAFSFVAAFTGAGQVRFANGILYGNTDANVATAEFEIALTGIITLAATDFVL